MEQRSFFQLAGHKECFKLGLKPDTILKLSTGSEEQCLRELMNDKLSPFVPRLFGVIQHEDGKSYLEMQDLLANFSNASVMDVKMGCRTYREEELSSTLRETKLRHDMYDKMVEVDVNEPTDEEKKNRAITKPRYMIWRETVSTTASLGFRIEGIRFQDGNVDKNFKTIKDEEQIVKAFMRYTKSKSIRLKYLNRLYALRQALTKSKFFSTHELIGSSLLFVHSESDNEASIWLIDFAKTHSLPENTRVTHRTKWELGNHEDGYLIGIDNLIRIYESIILRSNNDDQQQKLKTPSAPDSTSIFKLPARGVFINLIFSKQQF